MILNIQIMNIWSSSKVQQQDYMMVLQQTAFGHWQQSVMEMKITFKLTVNSTST